jgi:hypothetical protein
MSALEAAFFYGDYSVLSEEITKLLQEAEEIQS